ncbi:spore germination protein YaaH [Tumebacillus sp. BK434]|uniref:glycosyl hydrolase family 18 protein n=1 Tax=Tumebacillus sp. BK434 TaxID=2512169 RepID=UPI00104535CD|nr:glycosyl hydrolase family 18 protein [Tumebacillus sp. BK434]TCP59607.1 spore germination protein YaaH [Tumebacillus sp. BK434]
MKKKSATWRGIALFAIVSLVLTLIYTLNDTGTDAKKKQQPPPPVTEPAPAAVPIQAAKTVLGYYTVYHSGDQHSYHSLSASSSYLHQVSMMTFQATATGDISGTAATDGLQLAASKNIGAYAALTNETEGGFDKDLAHTVLADPKLRQKTVSNAVTLVTAHGFAGLNVDFENMLPSDRPLYTSFVTELAAALHANGKQLVVSMAAKTSDYPTSNWFGAFDYAAIGQAADQVQLMTYDENGPWGAPGSVAGYPWVESVVRYAVSQIPSTKILIGLPAYGYDWNTTAGTGKAVTWKGIPSLLATTGAAPQWDAVKQSPYFTYKAADGSAHTVWYENGKSIIAKTKLTTRYNLGGVSVWRMGLEDESFWQAVQSGLAP